MSQKKVSYSLAETGNPVIRIIGVSGSPRNEGTDYALNEALKAIKDPNVEVETINLRALKIQGCIHCGSCDHGKLFSSKGRYCSIRDDMEPLFEKLLRADAYIFASPVYGGNVSGQLKCFLDRWRALYETCPTEMKNGTKVGAAIAVGGSRHGGQQLVLQNLSQWFLWYGIIPVPIGSWECVGGAPIWSRVQDTGAVGEESHQSGRLGASQDLIGLEVARSMGDRLVRLARIIKAGKIVLHI